MALRCRVDGCDKPAKVKVQCLCAGHYHRLRRHGDPLGGRTPEGEPERYLREVVLSYTGDDCLIWPYARAANGYAHIRRDGSAKLVSRLVCEEVNGPPQPGEGAAHSCGNGKGGCVTPGHLDWKDQSGNEADKIIHGTSNRGERCGAAKLTRDQVRAVRTLRGKITGVALAERFGVTPSVICAIQKGRTWSWLKAEDREPGAEG